MGRPDIGDLGASWQRGSVWCSPLVVPAAAPVVPPGCTRVPGYHGRDGPRPLLRWPPRPDRHARPGAARPAHLGHRPLQLPLHLLHAQGGLRRGLRVPAARPGPDLRGDRADWRGRSWRSASRSSGSPAASRSSGATCRTSSRMLAALRTPDGGALDLTLTTNGSALRALAGPLADAGLRRVTVSLDSLDDAVFGAMNGIDFPVARVLDGIDAADRGRARAGQDQHGRPARRSTSRASCRWPRWARETGVDPALHRVHGRRPLERLAARRGRPRPRRSCDAIAAVWPLEPAEPRYRGEVAERWRYVDGGGEVGVIASVTQPFCRDCTRARLSAEGKLYTCLFAVEGHDLRAVLRGGAIDAELARRHRRRSGRVADDRYSELRSAATSDAAARSRCSRWAAERRSSTACPQRCDNSWTRGPTDRAEFVDNRVDPPSGRPVT